MFTFCGLLQKAEIYENIQYRTWNIQKYESSNENLERFWIHGCCNIINIIIAQWAKLRKKIATFLSLFIFTTFSVHTFTWCGKSLLSITKVTRNIRLTHIHYPDVRAFTNYPIDIDVLPQLSNIFLKFIYSEKATKFCKISILLLTKVHTDKS